MIMWRDFIMCKDNIPILKLDDIIGKTVDVEDMTTPDGNVIGQIYTTDKNTKYSIQDKSINDVKEKLNISNVVNYGKKKGDR
jgi:hypothetical protein